MSEYKYIVMDLDGTLVDVPVDWRKVRRDIEKKVGMEIGPSSLWDFIGRTIASMPELRETILSTLDSHELSVIDDVKLLRGTLESLSAASEIARLSVVTLQGWKACHMIMERFFSGFEISPVITREDSLTRVGQLSLVMKRICTSSKELLFVADRTNDLIASTQLGIDIVLIRTNPAGVSSPRYKLSNIGELPDLIKKIEKDFRRGSQSKNIG